MEENIKEDMTRRLNSAVQAFVDDLQGKGFTVDYLELITTFHYEVDSSPQTKQQRLVFPEEN